MPPVSKTTGLMFKDMVLIGAAVLGLSLLLILWARGHVRRSKRHRHEHRGETKPARQEQSITRHHHRHRHRHRRRHHSHEERGSKPTLAETGGLPPIRPQSSPNPPA
jgi:ABC-type nickel/cobalt efflux system permease component RcnA